jgi:hypothetical protein
MFESGSALTGETLLYPRPKYHEGYFRDIETFTQKVNADQHIEFAQP